MNKRRKAVAESRALDLERAAALEPHPLLARAFAAEATLVRTSKHPGNKLTPPCPCCKHRVGCGYHHASKSEDWDEVAGAGCMCPPS